MTNRSSAGKTHGLSRGNELRPKSTQSKRRNKTKAKKRKEEALKELKEALKGK
jgi:hypothetical protein